MQSADGSEPAAQGGGEVDAQGIQGPRGGVRAVRGHLLHEGEQHKVLSSMSLRGRQDPGEGESQSHKSRHVETETAGQTEKEAGAETAGRVPDTGEQAVMLEVPERGADRRDRMRMVDGLPAGTRLDGNTDRAGRVFHISLSPVRGREVKDGTDKT